MTQQTLQISTIPEETKTAIIHEWLEQNAHDGVTCPSCKKDNSEFIESGDGCEYYECPDCKTEYRIDILRLIPEN